MDRTSSIKSINISNNKMNKIMMDWYCDDSVLFGTWIMLEKIPSNSTSTIAISTKGKNACIKYNPNFISKLSQERLEMVMLSEMVRILLRHPTTRLLEPKEVSKLASNITVYENINKTVTRSTDPIVENLFESFEMEHDMYFEEYFRNILDKINIPKNKKILDGMKINCLYSLGTSKEDSEGYIYFDSEKAAMEEYNNPFNGSSDEWSDNQEWDETVKSHIESLQKSGKNWGKYTGSLQSTILAAKSSGINPRTYLSYFSQSVRKNQKYSSRMKYNRRFGLEAPGKRTKEISKILFAIDTSGSMLEDSISLGCGLVNHTCRHSELTYLLFDTEIKLIEKNFKRAKESFEIVGRGGTCVQKVIEYADANNFDGLIIFTDGHLERTSKPKCTNVVWLLTDEHPEGTFGYGKQIYLNKYWRK